jgi:hypothetical protein
MLPILLAPAGYGAKSAERSAVPFWLALGRLLSGESGLAGERGPRWENHPIPFRALPLLTGLARRDNGDALRTLAKDPRQNSAVRITCLLAHGGAAGLDVPLTLDLLDAEEKLDRRLTLVFALGHARDKAARDRLLALLDDGNRHLRSAAVRALASHRPADALPRLRELLDERATHYEADGLLRLLVRIGGKEVQAILAAHLRRTLDGDAPPGRTELVLSAFESATGRAWRRPIGGGEKGSRDAARQALEWWQKNNPS